MTGILDKLPPALRHYVFALAGAAALALLLWVQQTYTTWGLAEGVVAVIAAVLPILITALTTLTQQYGVKGDATAGVTVAGYHEAVPQDAYTEPAAPVDPPADGTPSA